MRSFWRGVATFLIVAGWIGALLLYVPLAIRSSGSNLAYNAIGAIPAALLFILVGMGLGGAIRLLVRIDERVEALQSAQAR
jgi:hypothetical protein